MNGNLVHFFILKSAQMQEEQDHMHKKILHKTIPSFTFLCQVSTITGIDTSKERRYIHRNAAPSIGYRLHSLILFVVQAIKNGFYRLTGS
jgi:hypothetical protein